MPAPLLTLLRIQLLTPGQRKSLLALKISRRQTEFAGTVERALDYCASATEEIVAGLAILHCTKPIGLVVLSRGSKRPSWAPANSVALTAMRIDGQEQGKGYGKTTLTLLDAWLSHHWPKDEAIALSVNEDNLAGRRIYASAGFSEYAEPRLGRVGVLRYLSKSIHR